MKIMKDSENAKFLGVCSGVSEASGINVTAVRVGFVASAVISAGTTFFVYLLLAFLMPSDIKED